MHRSTDALRRAARRVPPIVIALALFVMLPLLGLAAVVVGDLVPDKWVMEGLHGGTVDGSLDATSYDRGYSGRRLDQYSECKRITVGLGDPAGRSTFESAIRSPTLGPCETAVPKIVGWAEGGGLQQSYEYARYWNGSAVVFRPLVATLGVGGLRIAAAVVLVGAIAVTWHRLRRHVGPVPATLALVPLVITTDFVDLHGALLHALAWTLGLATFAVLLEVPVTASSWFVAAVGFVAGAVFLFFADMTNPEAAWLLAVAALAIPMVSAGATARSIVWRIGVAACSWIVGFAYMWFSKWVFGAMVYGVDAMTDNVRGQIEERVGGEHEGLGMTVFGGLELTWSEWWSSNLTLPVVIGSMAVVVLVIIRSEIRTWASDWPLRLLLVSPVLIPVLWYGLLRNHTQVHAWFVYRSLPVALGLALLAAVVPVRRSADVGVELVDEGS